MKQKPDLSRRQFLVRSAGLAGASLGLGAGKAPAAGARTDAVRVGIVGLGDRGRELLLRAMRVEELKVAAVCDLAPDRLKRGLDLAKSSGARGFTRAEQLAASPEIDALVIATPPHLHARLSLQALEAGKHVYCEKPMGLTLEECRAVHRAALEAAGRGQIYQIGFQRRYSPKYRAGVEYVRSGRAGRVLFVRAQWHAVSHGRRSKPWLLKRETSGGIVLEQATHQFDIFNWVFGEKPLAVSGTPSRPVVHEGPAPKDVLDGYSASLEYPGGAAVHFSHVTYAVPQGRFSGIYELVFCERAGVDLQAGLAWDPTGATHALTDAKAHDTEEALRAFGRAVRTGTPPAAGAGEALDAALVAFLTRRAVDEGRRLRLADAFPA